VGTVVGMDAFYDGKLVAHHAAMPVLYHVFGKPVKALLAINNGTHPDHQGKGLFTKIGNMNFDEAKQLGYHFVISANNQNSTYGYLNKFGFRKLAPLIVKVGIGKIIPDNANNYAVHSIWNEENLAWRLQNPMSKYYRNNDSIFAATNYAGFRAQMLSRECNLLKDKDLKSTKLPFTVWIGMSENLKRQGILVDLPDKLKPAPLNLLIKDLIGNIPLFTKEEIFYELIDLDAY